MIDKNLFLKKLQELDYEFFENLKEDVSYFDVHKAVFITRLKSLYDILILLSGTPFNLRIKQHKKCNITYYLIIPQLEKSLKFQLEEREGSISKIYCHKVIKDYNYGIIHSFCFFENERLDFKPTEEYRSILSNCEEAMQQFTTEKDKIFNMFEVKDWLLRFKILYKETKSFKHFKCGFLFFNFYGSIEHLMYDYKNYETAKKALIEFQTSISDEWRLLKWLRDYNRFYFCHSMGIFIFKVIEGSLIEVFSNPPIYVESDELETVYRFNKTYIDYYELIEN
ncbi:MAG: hypothetical protein M3Q58_11325 [Bacteroidota bacterium]|nr:hypothetical protein [Bacteroidota bacterium]